MALKFQRAFLGASFARIYPGGIPDIISQALRRFPLTVTSLHKWFPITSEFTVYAACPTCSCLYPPQNGVYPVMCTWDEFEAAKKKRREELASQGKSDINPDNQSGRKGRRRRKQSTLEPTPCNTILVHNPK
jgi:hypothetical protein